MPSPDSHRPTQKPPAFRLAHISDIHFGKISHPGVVDALVNEVNRGDFDVVVISGDITQRAREREFRPAMDMINAIEPPLVIVPGNHDVPPWWRPFDRLFDAGGPSGNTSATTARPPLRSNGTVTASPYSASTRVTDCLLPEVAFGPSTLI